MDRELPVSVWPEWKIIEKIGEGSFGKVYKAQRMAGDKAFYSAIKIISIPANQSELKSVQAEIGEDQSVREYFRNLVDECIQEVSTMEYFRGNSHVVAVEDYKVVEYLDAIGWDIYIRMEYVTSFLEYCSGKQMGEDEVIQLGIDLCKALEYCRKLNIIHRDIKPENIFVSRFGEFKLGDFGIARQLERSMSTLSKKGTYSYMAPEMYKGEKYDSGVDIYSLGIMLYKLRNRNRLPFLSLEKQLITYRDKENALTRRMSGEQLLPPVDAGEELAGVILKACAYKKEDRYFDPEEFRQALEDLKYHRRKAERRQGGETQTWQQGVRTQESGRQQEPRQQSGGGQQDPRQRHAGERLQETGKQRSGSSRSESGKQSTGSRPQETGKQSTGSRPQETGKQSTGSGRPEAGKQRTGKQQTGKQQAGSSRPEAADRKQRSGGKAQNTGKQRPGNTRQEAEKAQEYQAGSATKLPYKEKAESTDDVEWSRIDSRKKKKKKSGSKPLGVAVIIMAIAVTIGAVFFSKKYLEEHPEDTNQPSGIVDVLEENMADESEMEGLAEVLTTIRNHATTIVNELDTYHWIGTERDGKISYLNKDGKLRKVLIYPNLSEDGVYEEYYYWDDELFFAYIWEDSSTDSDLKDGEVRANYYYYQDRKLIRWIDQSNVCHDYETDNEKYNERGEKYWKRSVEYTAEFVKSDEEVNDAVSD